MAHGTLDLMKAAVIERFGGLDELHVQEVHKPHPKPDEVLVRIRAAGVGIWDSLQRAGSSPPDHPHFPLVLGAECAGDVEQTGSAVTSLKEGDAVYSYFYGDQGAYAEYAAIKAEYVARKPDKLSYEEAAAVPVDAITAYQALVDECKLEAEQWVFIAGGAGGVGTMAVQIAANLGARVIASARAENFGYLESLGVARANLIDYTQSDVVAAVRSITGGSGVDVALDAVGGANSQTTIKAVRDGGRLGELTGEDLATERNVTVFHIGSKPSAKTLDILTPMLDAGQLKVHIDRTFSLSHARQAQELVEKRHVRGKVVLQID